MSLDISFSMMLYSILSYIPYYFTNPQMYPHSLFHGVVVHFNCQHGTVWITWEESLVKKLFGLRWPVDIPVRSCFLRICFLFVCMF